ncbi:MAG: diguanylate cyclase [Magnetococcales bacterium]|nr:diguanylate cyclase [Magnetococcales bacterium]
MDNQARILIVDDERFNINVLVDLLKPDYEMMVAKNGEQALKRVQSSRPPDLVLLDIMMPDMDGYEVCHRLKEDPLTRDIPIIFVTAMDKTGDEEQGLALGAVDYITKPFSPALVKLRVKNHLRLKQQNDRLRNLATLDGLTGIPNRRFFDQHLNQEWRRSLRNGSPISIILMDIDHFKQYNDHYGHAAGDECLKQVSGALAAVVGRAGDLVAHCGSGRATDLVARYGGEEFVCVLPDTDGPGVAVVGERLRTAVYTLNIPHEHSGAASHVTISLGGATLTPCPTTPPSSLIENADRNLYRSKEQGRNRLTI